MHIIGAVGISFPLRAADFQFLPTELHANVTNLGGGRVKTPNINKKNSLYVLVWMYNEFLFFYKKEPYKQFIWRYMGQISPQIRENSSLGHFCHHFLYIKGNGKEGKVHFDLVYTDMAKTIVRHVVFYLPEDRFRLDASPASMP